MDEYGNPDDWRDAQAAHMVDAETAIQYMSDGELATLRLAFHGIVASEGLPELIRVGADSLLHAVYAEQRHREETLKAMEHDVASDRVEGSWGKPPPGASPGPVGPTA